uniref:Putative secreted protein n=1 Tax=Anopheles marajoara TaxID=58244 RepID=A0A2M4CBR4_9DIPT
MAAAIMSCLSSSSFCFCRAVSVLSRSKAESRGHTTHRECSSSIISRGSLVEFARTMSCLFSNASNRWWSRTRTRKLKGWGD